jgi:heme exporter protein D
MNAFLQWFNMGGYGAYVWSAYGMVSMVLVLNVLGIQWNRRRTRALLGQWFKRQL